MIQFEGSVGKPPPPAARSPIDVARQAREREEQAEVLRRAEHLVVRIALAHHRVAEAVRRRGELDRHVGYLLEAVELAPVMQDLGDDARFGEPLDPVVQHDPLIVPGHDPARLAEDIGRRIGAGREHVADLVVELQHREMRLRHQQVLVVAMIADQREALGAARQVVAEIALAGVEILADQELRPVLVAGGRVARIEMRAAVGTETVDAVEIDARGAEILDAERVFLLVAERREIERDVVIDHLPEIREAARDVRIVAGRAAGVVVDHRIGERLQLGVADLQRRQHREHPAEHAGVLVAGERIEQLTGGVTPGDAVSRGGLDGVGRRGRSRLELGDGRSESIL